MTPQRPRLGSLCTGAAGLDMAVVDVFDAEATDARGEAVGLRAGLRQGESGRKRREGDRMTQGRSDDERAVSKMLREANEAAGRFRAGDASRDPFDELSALSRGFTAAMARLTDDALDHAADYVAERTARLAAEAQVAQLQAENKRLRGDNDDFLRAICMILDAKLGGRFTFTQEALVSYPRNRELVVWDDPRTFSTVVETRLAAASDVAPPRTLREWIEHTEQQGDVSTDNIARFSGVAPDKPAPGECDDRAPMIARHDQVYCTREHGHRGPHRNGEMEWRHASTAPDKPAPTCPECGVPIADVCVHMARLVAAIDAPDQPNGDKR